jgi:HK97 family phage prohead protease
MTDKQQPAEPVLQPAREQRTLPIENVEWRKSGSGDQLTIRGHASIFDRLSLDLGGFRERIAPGAFTSALDRNPDVHALWDHDTKMVLARTKNKTLELREDPIGLHFWAKVADTSYARDLRVLMERGDVDQASFAFTVARDEWMVDEDENVTRTILEVGELYDVTVTAQGAYPQSDASVVAHMRSRVKAEIEAGTISLEEAALQRIVAPDEPAGASTSQSDLGDGEKRILAPDEVEDDSSQNDLGEEERVSSVERERTLNEMAEAVAVAREQKREFEKRKYELKARKE